ncbi:MAG: addiction module protein [Phycisphaerae bacterium]
MTTKQIRDEALKLPTKARADLARTLIASLDEVSRREADDLWADEADRRYRELKNGRVKGRPAEAVHRDVRARIA